MFEIDAGRVWAMIMIMGGDVLVLLALGASFLLLLGALLNARDLAARSAGAGLLALVATGWTFAYKLGSSDLAAEANGIFFGFGNGLVGSLLGLAVVLWLAGFALLLVRRLA